MPTTFKHEICPNYVPPKTFQAIIISAGYGDPLSYLTFPYGTEFEAGQLIATPFGLGEITEICMDEDYGALLQIYCKFEHGDI